ncbi:unnamed protein product [Thlaspi arvense]|uniref:F-box domain-containing protein n=1 Tax=Thlaspi arvense TaxID=13288 RepID=A0AAU9T8X1_THLAR|nr:unnamed protein product [Thlaspi arvense]
MDRISGLPDELLVKILSIVGTKDAASTSILSKRWKFLWMWLPELKYMSTSTDIDNCGLLRNFIDKNMPLHRASVIEKLCFELRDSNTEDSKRWVEIAVSRHVHELEITHYSDDSNVLPSSFYTCKSLVILKLSGVVLRDAPSMACLPSLKDLQIDCVTYADDATLQRLLDICPVIEELDVHCDDYNLNAFTIIVPTLQCLSLFLPEIYINRYVIDTPSLQFFYLDDWDYVEHDFEIKDMPQLSEAYVNDYFFALKNVIKSITSIKHLTICSEDHVYGDGLIFNQLERLTICVCQKGSSNLLVQLLKDSPNLRVLQLFRREDEEEEECSDMDFWNEQSHVPKCLLSSLHVFKWLRYFGRPQDRDLTVYILKNACCLKKAVILADSVEYDVPSIKMIKELALSTRASSTCELVFNEDENHIEG